jgi:Arc/MetJ-type ribon-helix-helix transcriptional regulator
MADWLLAQVERGHFVDPSDAVFAIVKNFIDMEPHRDLRDELLRRILDESVARGLEDVKAGRVRPADEVFDALRRSWRSPAPSRSAGRRSHDEPARPLPSSALALPALIAAADERARLRFLEFFAVTIRNPHTRRAYMRAAGDFLAWCEARGVASLEACSRFMSRRGSRRLGASWPRPASSSSSPACATCSTGW